MRRGIVLPGVLLLLAAPARGADVRGTAAADHDNIRLSDSVRVTLAVEGSAPLRVTLPKEPLDDNSAATWRARPAGPPLAEPLPGGKERWSLVYRVDPYAAGEALPLQFAPVRVFAGTDPEPKDVTWPALTVRVVSGVKGESAADARPPTSIEELPPVPSGDGLVTAWLLAIPVAILIALALLVRRIRRRVPPPSPEEWAAARFAELDGATADGAYAERLSGVVRGYIERRTGIPATKLTTAELLASLDGVEAWPPDRVADVRTVLERCDLAKFAGGPAEVADLLAVAEQAVSAGAPA